MAVDTSTTSWTVGAGAMSARDAIDAALSLFDANPEQALGYAQKARVLARNENDPAAEAEALYRVASIVHQTGDPADAFGLALDARDLAARCGSARVEMMAVNLLALIHHRTSNYAEALRCGLAAHDIYRVHRDSLDPELESGLLNTVAMVYQSLSDLERALVTYEHALNISRSGTRPAMQATALLNIAEIKLERRELWAVSGLLDEALELARAHAPDMVPGLLFRLADCHIAMDKAGPAGVCVAEARALLRASGRGEILPSETSIGLLMCEGHLAELLGEDEAAIASFAEAREHAERTGLRDAILRADAELATVHKRLGRFEEALHHQEARFRLRDELFGEQADLRTRTLQTAHDTATARQQAEILRLRTGELEELVRGRTSNLEDSQFASFQQIAELAERRRGDRVGHIGAVGELSREIADALGEQSAWARSLELAAQLHDIGLIALPDRVLHHDERVLGPEDRDVLRSHTSIGASLLEGSVSGVVRLAAEVAAGHHEHWDGSGYPSGASAVAIPLSARIVAVADAYDAALNGGRSRPAPTPTPVDAATEVRAGSGTRFEPRIVEALLTVIASRHPEHARALGALVW